MFDQRWTELVKSEVLAPPEDDSWRLQDDVVFTISMALLILEHINMTVWRSCINLLELSIFFMIHIGAKGARSISSRSSFRLFEHLSPQCEGLRSAAVGALYTHICFSQFPIF